MKYEIQLWVDDLRPAPKGWEWIKTSDSAIGWLRWVKYTQEHPNMFEGRNEAWPWVVTKMSLDHDLGGSDTTRPVVLWCCENNWWPDETHVHSANPVGIEWLVGMIERYGK